MEINDSWGKVITWNFRVTVCKFPQLSYSQRERTARLLFSCVSFPFIELEQLSMALVVNFVYKISG